MPGCQFLETCQAAFWMSQWCEFQYVLFTWALATLWDGWHPWAAWLTGSWEWLPRRARGHVAVPRSTFTFSSFYSLTLPQNNKGEISRGPKMLDPKAGSIPENKPGLKWGEWSENQEHLIGPQAKSWASLLQRDHSVSCSPRFSIWWYALSLSCTCCLYFPRDRKHCQSSKSISSNGFSHWQKIFIWCCHGQEVLKPCHLAWTSSGPLCVGYRSRVI